jgi:hypothetical protein
VGDVGARLPEGSPPCGKADRTGLAHRLEDQPITRPTQQGAVAGLLGVDGHADGLVSVVSEQADLADVGIGRRGTLLLMAFG